MPRKRIEDDSINRKQERVVTDPETGKVLLKTTVWPRLPGEEEERVSEIGADEEEANPAIQQFAQMVGAMAQNSGISGQLFKVDEKGGEEFCCDISAGQLGTLSPFQYVKKEYGPGSYHFKYPTGDQVEVLSFKIAGAGKPENGTPGATVWNVMPGSDGKSILPQSADNQTAMMSIMFNFLQAQMHESAEDRRAQTRIMAEIVRAPEKSSKSELNTFLEFHRAMKEEKTMKWESVLDTILKVTERIVPLLGGGKEDDSSLGGILKSAVAQKAGVLVEEILGIVKGVRTNQANTNSQVNPQLAGPAPATSPAGAGQLPMHQGPIDPNMVTMIRQYVAANFIDGGINLVWQADRDLDPYTVVTNLRPQLSQAVNGLQKQMGVAFAETQILDALGFSSAKQMFATYPSTALGEHRKEWFEDFVEFLLHPEQEPAEEGEEEEHGEILETKTDIPPIKEETELKVKRKKNEQPEIAAAK